MSMTNLQSPSTNNNSAEGFSDGSVFSVSIGLTMSPAYSKKAKKKEKLSDLAVRLRLP